ncbi:PTS ascorbate transporter subunit IIB [Atlantibacter hermannii]|uniref:PTS sugar transporter subunit IIB n=1 Tax=Atlantibacter subterraneus TaxID=255519 RepID=A0A427V271_9ENTR|nr:MULTISPECIES: PTS sugar transporter subunit IIB [Enterobacteriaceae]QFH71523.1 PTS sugar transporter subunit IIB [Enterobacter sp. E76]MBB3323419.1 PTS system ascorbate-specific IIB component [Atlantibacter sp. RC6]MBL7637113.1 PTS sugar transporter subunit IIB [Atlantibacter hermannii]MBL7675695.1 PTS sugar transporter subunit IIB [Atlantibacter hermannii]MDA3133292.1 PTS sugar transporter subunit IIB [Atlantibacter subterranea]
MKILTVCGLGMGSSLILRMNVETVLKKHGVEANVEHMDVSAAASANADLVITNAELVGNLQHLSCPVVVVNNYIDTNEITQALVNAGILTQG